MLFSLLQPASLAGLLVAFGLGLYLRTLGHRVAARLARFPGTPRQPLRRLVDPFGVVAAALVGTGWGRMVDPDDQHRFASRGRRAAVIAAGPLAVLLLGLVAAVACRLLYPGVTGATLPGNVLRGQVLGSYLPEFVLAVTTGLCAFGVLQFIPLPPLDGFALLWLSFRNPSPHAQRARHWLVDNNLGVGILLVCVFFPLARPVLLWVLDLILLPLLWIWL